MPVTPAPVAPPPPKTVIRKTVIRTTRPAKPIRQPAPKTPEGIRNRIYGEIPIDVRLHIGRNGNVVGAALMNPSRDGVQSYLGQRALEAVRHWKFEPVRVGNRAVPADRTVRFRFRRSGTQWSIRS
jgi:TonB family protein